MTAGDSGESGKGVMRVVNSFACKMGSSWREISGQQRPFIQVIMTQDIWPAEAFYSGDNDPGRGH